MSKSILVAVAWPYANAHIHVGNLTGSHLPADICARYHRMRGRDVLMVSGSDAHGTPITVRADAENLPAIDVYQRFHKTFLDLFQQVGITYDLFTSTHTENHFKVSQNIFKSLGENGYLYTDKKPQWYAPTQGRFLPDRYVEGTCYVCGSERARSDQCEKCGSLLEPELLVNPRSKIDGSTPELRETEHFYLDLSKLQSRVEDFLSTRESFWRPNVIRQSLGQMRAEPLHGRPITRDLDWGIPIPIEGWEGKCLYVWFEAVIGYLSATVEWSQVAGVEGGWRKWWTDPEARATYFIGKDNIPFHAVNWPAQLIGAEKTFDALMGSANPAPLTLPYDVPANEFMNLEGDKISGSRNWAVYVTDFLTRYDPDPLRYYLTVNMPEAKDTDWDWGDFYRRNNDELVATWGNLANRMLSFAYKHFDQQTPDPGDLTDVDLDILRMIEDGFESVGKEIETVQLRAALREAMRLATEVNKYLDMTAPWHSIKTDRQAAARAVYVALRAIDSLKVLFSPFLPFSSEKLHTYLGYETSMFGEQYLEEQKDALGEHLTLRYKPDKATAAWSPSQLPVGQKLKKPKPLFRKLLPEIVEEERARLGKPVDL